MACPPLSSDVAGGEGSTVSGTHSEDLAHKHYPPLYAVSLALPGEYVKFGSVVQMVAPDMPASRGGESGKLGMVLAGLVGEKEVDCIQHFVHGCALSASPLLTPCVRNAFIIHRLVSWTILSLCEEVKEGFGNQIDLCQDRGLNPGKIQTNPLWWPHGLRCNSRNRLATADRKSEQARAKVGRRDEWQIIMIGVLSAYQPDES
ncbi:unnamed protein product [Timema podura]|uniref:Uncharacterized protein n=1 Tax=Timema podura TaxID=61482 RepID=A0ABN7NGF5_TIMPD|nr:unnamed protein product [Timema podura]